MAHSYAKIWIHAVWSTKGRRELLKGQARGRLVSHLKEAFHDLECPVKVAYATFDHVHVLFSLSPKRSVAEVIKAVKGETSHWANQQSLTSVPFAWQVGYGAFSVSESALARAANYVRNQATHHRKMDFGTEFELLLRKHGLALENR